MNLHTMDLDVYHEIYFNNNTTEDNSE